MYLYKYAIWSNWVFPGKSKKVKKKRKKDHRSSKVDELMEKRTEADQDEVFSISSGDEDCLKGMKSMKNRTVYVCVLIFHDMVSNSW